LSLVRVRLLLELLQAFLHPPEDGNRFIVKRVPEPPLFSRYQNAKIPQELPETLVWFSFHNFKQTFQNDEIGIQAAR